MIRRTALLLLLAALLLAAGLLERQDRRLPVYGISYQHTREQLVAMYPGLYFWDGPRESRQVALTFDDGPDDEVTPQVLDVLKENAVRGTFFLIGKSARQHPALTRRIAAEGHVIANHTWSHPNMAQLGQDRVRQEIEKTEETLEALTGRRTALIRLPWGAVTDNIMAVLQKKGYRVIGWSVDSFDWRDPGDDRVLASLNAHMHPGAIVLLHAVNFPHSAKVTLKVLPALIKDLKNQGYQFVTIDEMLKIPAYRPA